MNVFEHFPDTAKCPFCGGSEDKSCVLIGIDGTEKGNIEQAAPAHADCIRDAKWRIKKGIIYTRVEQSTDQRR